MQFEKQGLKLLRGALFLNWKPDWSTFTFKNTKVHTRNSSAATILVDILKEINKKESDFQLPEDQTPKDRSDEKTIIGLVA